jgi:hypothetical protein
MTCSISNGYQALYGFDEPIINYYYYYYYYYYYWPENSCYFELNVVGSLIFIIYKYDLEIYLVSGPSYVVDTACSSSMFAIEHAYRAMREGLCDSAIVGGCSLCLHPYVSLNFFRLGILSHQGACRSFDKDGMYLLYVRCAIILLL